VFFCYATLYVCCFGDGLQAEFTAQRKADKKRRKHLAEPSAGEVVESEPEQGDQEKAP